MNVPIPLDLAASWRSEAKLYRRRGQEQFARMIESLAVELEDSWRDWWSEELSVSAAAGESGYTEEHLRQLVRDGRVPTDRPRGSRAEILIRRCDLPKKAPRSTLEVVDDFSMKLAQ